jgi:hypothetical protein
VTIQMRISVRDTLSNVSVRASIGQWAGWPNLGRLRS